MRSLQLASTPGSSIGNGAAPGRHMQAEIWIRETSKRETSGFVCMWAKAAEQRPQYNRSKPLLFAGLVSGQPEPQQQPSRTVIADVESASGAALHR